MSNGVELAVAGCASAALGALCTTVVICIYRRLAIKQIERQLTERSTAVDQSKTFMADPVDVKETVPAPSGEEEVEGTDMKTSNLIPESEREANKENEKTDKPIGKTDKDKPNTYDVVPNVTD